MERITETTAQTERFAAEFAGKLKKNGEKDAFLAMYGDLGVGKTAFVRGLASVLTPDCRVTSPTYTIVNEYRGKDGWTLCHFDMYRITGDDDLYSVGFYDYTDCVCAAEWCENVPFALPPHYYRIEISKLAEAYAPDPVAGEIAGEIVGEIAGEIADNGRRLIRITEVGGDE